ATIVALLAVSSSFTRLAILANVSALTLYMTCVVAAFELQRRDERSGGVPFILPGGPAIPALAVIVIVWLLSNASRREFLVLGAVLIAATAVYLRPRRVQKDPAYT